MSQYPYGLVGGFVDRSTRAPSNEFIRGGNAGNKVVLGLSYALDPTLPQVGTHPASHEPIVIPKGTILKIPTTALNTPGMTLSICGAADVPFGVAPIIYTRQNQNLMRKEVPAPLRDQQITMPYVSAINDANGSLSNGDLLMSDSSGNFVKWDGTTVSLIAGRCDVIDTRGGATPGWLKWVTADFAGWGYGLMSEQNIKTTVTLDGLTNTSSATNATMSWHGSTITLGATPASSLKCDTTRQRYFLTNKELSNNFPVDVYVGGVLQDKDVIPGVYGYGDGANYLVDFLNGVIRFTSVIPTTATVQATYAYESDWVGGRSWGQGVVGLTDGSVSGMGAGVPPWLDVAGSTGRLFITLRGF